ncbi:universal stress protein [Natrarchaeobaculum sulfurireducens]|uniref:Nucleotide-binding protein, UspA family n=1 Tax=Natrarchaeobaculum sulfurireducens TaxID=2044521 RepID=A0A346PGT8_9EURY|nr:universal stress protein [Natrarchaeobaculum sulfurireducens]AXR78733.1 Nucleotide-binding protein, UspA family [Natrarchaeobaculum sulfurireducens]AXR81216.1 Universal stress protein [Natrarchaeobaculum sulfurireducens]
MTFLVATDGSAVSDTAVEHAAHEASTWETSLQVVHVLTPETEFVDGNLVLPGEAEAIEHGERTLEQAEQVAAETAADHDTEIEIETELLAGRPAESIAEYAEKADVRGIYVGHRGFSDKREQVVGSVAKTVVDKATVPVTIIK